MRSLIVDLVTAVATEMKKFENPADLPLILLVFDEASNMSPTIIASIRRVFRALRSMPVWGIFLSTFNSIPQLQPDIHSDPSGRIGLDSIGGTIPF